MKMKILPIIILLSCISICSCEQNTLTPLESSQSNINDLTDTVDISSYSPTEIYSLPGIGYFKFIDAPGMVLYTDQSQGATLAYINKLTEKSFYFCFDPTCAHYECSANILHLTNHMVYCNGKLYAVRPEPELGGAGTTLYSTELDATGLKECYQSDGNEIYNLLVYENTILFTQGKTDGGRDIISYDTVSGKSKIISEEYDLDIESYFTANNAIYYTFIGDTYLYRTNDYFETSDKLFDVAKMSNKQYGDSTHIYGLEYQADETDELKSKAIVRCSLENGDIETVYESTDERLYFAGIDDAYCYFYHITKTETPYKRSDGKPIINGSGGILYRIPKEGGQHEVVLNNIDYNISFIEKYDGNLYVLGHKYYQRGEVGVSTTFTGILVNGEIKEIVPR